MIAIKNPLAHDKALQSAYQEYGRYIQAGEGSLKAIERAIEVYNYAMKGIAVMSKAWDKFKADNYERQTAAEHCVIAERYTGAPCYLYTLDGTKDAIICGRLYKFATIRAMDNTISIEVNWPLVERKMQGDKTFYTC